MLSPPDQSEDAKPYELVADASGLGIGAALFQGVNVVAFEGRKYKPAECNYTVGEQELLAVVHALEKWRCYLEGAPQFTVVTDHNPLIWLQTQQNLSRRQSRWSEFMQRFSFKWVYRPGRNNVADPLSRAPSLRDKPSTVLHDNQVMVILSQFGLHNSNSSRDARTVALMSISQTPPVVDHSPDGGIHPVYDMPGSGVLSHSMCAVAASLCHRQFEWGSRQYQSSQPSVDTAATIDTLSEYWGISDTDGLLCAALQPTVRRSSRLAPVSPSPLESLPSPPDAVRSQTSSHDAALSEPNVDKQAHHSVGADGEQPTPGDGDKQPDGGIQTVMLKQVHAEAELFQQLDSFLEEVKEGYSQDDWFNQLRNTNSLVRDKRGLYWKGHALVIPKYKELRAECMKLCHDAPWAAHLGRDKTSQLVASMYYWPKVSEDVREHIHTCPKCQVNKPSNRKPAGLLVPLQVPERRWTSISVDLITHLPRTVRSNDAVIVFVDRLSKRVHYVASQTTISAEQFAVVFVDTIFKHHGLPLEIVSDRDARFISKFWSEVTRMLGVQRCMSTAFHPRTDGQTERANRTLEEALRAYVSTDQSDWDSHLPLVEFAVNNSHHVSIGTTPFLMDYGQSPLVPGSVELTKVNPSAKAFVGNWGKRVSQAKNCMRIAQERASSVFNRKVEAVSFACGDKVLLATKNLVFKGLKFGERAKKLLPKYVGPFTILERVGLVAYKLELPPRVNVHPVFHVNLLKEWKSDGSIRPNLAELELVGGEAHFELESFVNSRMGGSKKAFRMYLVRWKGYDPSYDEWVYEDDLLEDSPVLARSLIKAYWANKESRTANKRSKK